MNFMNSDNIPEVKRIFASVFNIVSYWLYSISILGLILYFIPPNDLKGSWVDFLSGLTPGINRLALNGVYPDQFRLVWMYILAALPVILVASLLRMNFTFEFNKSLKTLYSNSLLLLFVRVFLVSIISFFILRVILLGVVFNEPLTPWLEARESIRGSIFSSSYVGRLVFCVMSAFCSVFLLSMNIFLFYHVMLRFLKGSN